MSASEDRSVGSFVGPYRISMGLGAGGMGVVYEAVAPDGTCVALKMLPAGHATEALARRLQDEGTAGLAISHPNVASTLACGKTADGAPFVVMERVRGERLSTCIHHDRFSLRECASISRQVLAGLEAMHAAGIVHGDIKSDNVMVERQDDGSDVAKLIDLGLAHVQFEAASAATGATLAGTPEYMAPELVDGAESSPASDLYAVGVVLYELITGATPFVDQRAGEVLRRQLHDPAVPPSLRRPNTPPILDRIVMRALDKNPARRFPCAASFASALAVASPVLDVVDEPRDIPRFSREAPTVDWIEGARTRRMARGTPST
jgi:serine/threonine protein kinase